MQLCMDSQLNARIFRNLDECSYLQLSRESGSEALNTRPILRPIMLNAFILQQLIERYLKLNSFVFQIHKQTPMILSPEHKQRLV